MKYYIIILTICIGFILTGCSKLEENISQPSVITVHKPGISNPHSSEFHGNLIMQANWSMASCQQCHGATFKGAGKAADCTSSGCHNSDNGPLSCNTCHGDFNNPSRIAPPQDISDSTSTTIKGVGAHVSHLYENGVSVVRCSNCHTRPRNGVYSPGHVDTPLPAEITFDSLSMMNIATNAEYNYANTTCANSYCHGNFEFTKADAPVERRFAYTADKMTGLNKTVLWTKVDNTEAACGSCHGLPPQGHIAVSDVRQCVSCHATVINDKGEIINKEKHIDGKVNFGLD